MMSIMKVLGGHISTKYPKAKKEEWNDYQAQVTSWEMDRYLYRT